MFVLLGSLTLPTPLVQFQTHQLGTNSLLITPIPPPDHSIPHSPCQVLRFGMVLTLGVGWSPSWRLKLRPEPAASGKSLQHLGWELGGGGGA